jgi:hypothetical protein
MHYLLDDLSYRSAYATLPGMYVGGMPHVIDGDNLWVLGSRLLVGGMLHFSSLGPMRIESAP